jgi:hypothetical protein
MRSGTPAGAMTVIPAMPHRAIGPGVIAAAGAAITAAAAAFFLSRGKVAPAAVLVAAPLVAFVIARPTALLLLLAASLPAVQSLTGEGSHSVALSDVLLALIGAGLLAQAAVFGERSFVAALRPIAFPLLQFCCVVLLLLPFHPGVSELLQTVQRLELLVLPLAIGAFAVFSGCHVRVLEVYVLSATVLGVVWQYDDLGLQKNPVGQFIANAALIVVGVPALRRLLPCLLVLTPTLLLTESRGAIVAAALGLATLILLQSSRSHALITRGVPVVAIAVAAFALVPSSVQERVTTLSSAGNSPAAYSISLREQQADDARELIAEHPWTGVGIGNYLTGDSSLGTQTDDPHQVLLLQAAEGGYVLAASFVVLIAGTLLVLGRVRRIETAPAAAAVLVATVAHGLVDVFWVRGTPVLTWLLIGMTLGLLARAPSTGRA